MREAPEIGGVRCPGVVLLHGIARGSSSLGRLERSLQAAGFATLNIDYASRRKPIAALADDIHPAIARFAEREAPLHFVAHSMGGLVTRAYLAKHRPARLGGVVVLGTPNVGSEVADLLSRSRLYRAFYGPAGLELTTANRSDALPIVVYPVGVIAGNRFIDPIAGLFVLPKPNDGRVSVQSAMLAGMADHIVLKASHTGLPRDAAAIEQRSLSSATATLHRRQRAATPSQRDPRSQPPHRYNAFPGCKFVLGCRPLHLGRRTTTSGDVRSALVVCAGPRKQIILPHLFSPFASTRRHPLNQEPFPHSFSKRKFNARLDDENPAAAVFHPDPCCAFLRRRRHHLAHAGQT